MNRNEALRPSGWAVIAGVAAGAALTGFLVARSIDKPVPQAEAPLPAETRKDTAPDQPSNVSSMEVSIPGEYLAVADIAIEPVSGAAAGAELYAPATVTALPGSEAVIMSRAAGTVRLIQRKLGDTVRAGDVLALVDSPEAAAMSAERAVALTRADLARKAFERESSLFRQGVTPLQEMESAKVALDVAEAEAYRASTIAKAANVSSDGRSVALVSPIAGKISAQSVVLGAYVLPQAELFRVAGKGAVQVEASVTATDMAKVAVNGDALIVPASGSSVAARVRAITPTVSGSARTATVVVVPLDPASRLVVGEGVQVRLHVRAGDASGLSVPEDAVQNLDGQDVLFVRTGSGFRVRPVTVGVRSGGMAQILSGVAAGEPVATRNAFLLKAEMKKAGGGDE